MKNFDPVNIEDVAVHNKKVQEVGEWIKTACTNSNNDMLLLSGPVGSGKTATVRALASKYNIKITEWITPLDIEYPSEFGNIFIIRLLQLKYIETTNKQTINKKYSFQVIMKLRNPNPKSFQNL